MYLSTKTYGQEEGLSAVFRQHRAGHSHCSLLHGYALGFKFTFGCDSLDDRNWVQDFGGLKQLKQYLKDTFDHKLVVAADDPKKDDLCALAGLGLANVLVLDAVGCEAFAKYAFNLAERVIQGQNAARAHRKDKHYVRVVSVECSEHGANSAVYLNPGV